MNKNRVIYSFPDVGRATLKAVQAGDAPRERLFGAVQLLDRGWAVSICDAQWEGWAASIRVKFARWLEFPALKTCVAIWRADIFVIQGRLAPFLLLLSKIFGTKLVYIDVMFDIPKHRMRRWLTKLCLWQADGIIGYSKTQAIIWSKEFGIPKDKIITVPYPMDSDFYIRPMAQNNKEAPFVLCVGRDIGRDFDTLLTASEAIPIDVKLVTLPYLLPKSWNKRGRVEVLQRLSYQELFNFYRRSTVAVVPLKSGVSYPSGIRAVLEAMLLRTPVVATYTSVLAEYFNDGEHLLYVEAGNQKALADAIKRVLENPSLVAKLVDNAWITVNRDFKVEQFADTIENTFIKLT